MSRFDSLCCVDCLISLQVKSITPAQSPSDTDQWTVITNDDTSTNYQAVIISAPIHQTSIALPDSIIAQVPLQPYVHLHVTLLTTTSPVFNPTYFGLGVTDIGDLPGMMLTTNQGVREGGKEPEFNSISYHGKVQEGEWAVKIFSKEEISDEWLDKMFNGTVTWVHRKLVSRQVHTAPSLSRSLTAVSACYSTVAILPLPSSYNNLPTRPSRQGALLCQFV